MKRLFVIGFLMSSLLSLCGAQPKMRDIFLQMPNSMLPYLTENNKLDFIDFIDSNMDAVVTNELGGKSQMLELSDKHLTLKVSASAIIKMHLMPVNEPVDSCNQVICMLTTYGQDIKESKLEVFSVHWRPLDAERYVDIPRQPYVIRWFDNHPTDFYPVNVKEPGEVEEVLDEPKEDNQFLKCVHWKP